MTAQDLINLCLGDIGVLAPGETISPDDSAYCLSQLNLLLGSLSAQALPIYEVTRDTFDTNGFESYTFGPGQTWATTRPVKIKAAASTRGGHSEPVEIVTAEQWAAIEDKSLAGYWAKRLFWDGGYPTGNVYLWPIASPGGTIQLDSYKPLSTFATLETTVDLPPGYDRALVKCLAPEIAGGFGKPVTNGMIALANDAKASIFGLNQAVLGHPAGAQPPPVPVVAPAQ